MERAGRLDGRDVVGTAWRLGVAAAATVALALGIAQPAGAASGDAPTAEEPTAVVEGAAPAPVTGDSPAGSDAGSAAAIEGDSGTVVAPNFSGASEPDASDLVAPSLWWRWTAPAAGEYRFHTHGSEMDTVLTVRSGSADALTEVGANDDAGSVVTSEVTVPVEADETLYLEVTAKNGDPGFVTLGWIAQSPPASSSVQSQATGPSEVTALATFRDVPVSANTGEKPQSKLWRHDGTWWAVLASTEVSPAGTWLWRYGTGGWTNVLRLADDPTMKADTKPAGNVTHVLLHGPSPVLVSLEYVAAQKTYRPWSQRSTPTRVSLTGSETATIDIDSKGRMWLASDTVSTVEVRYADAPYRSFSGPVTLASGITEDDIAAVTAIPGGKVGVLWSDESKRRFGFRTHTDGAAPGTWSNDEVPASQSAVSIGQGMADDHVNMAVAKDGTLYAAVKTEYDTSGYPVIGLLVRRPSGSWDSLREVDDVGTRPIIQLDESTGTLRVFYTSRNGFNDILMKEASTRDLKFPDAPKTVISGGFNNVTSTKQNVSGALMVMASSESVARSATIGSDPQPQPQPQPSTMERWAGADRYAVSANVSSKNFERGVGVAYIANGLTSVDALSAAPVAGMKDAPVLLTRATALPAEVAAELKRLQPRKIVILGGTGAVSSAVQRQLAAYAPSVTRWSGSDRFEVSAVVSSKNFDPGLKVAYVANGLTSVDALSAAPVAGSQGAPVLLTRSDALPGAVAAELRRLRPQRIVILGGTGAVSSAVQAKLAGYTDSVGRWSGADRYAVSVTVSRANFGPGEPVVYVANGLTSVDALSAAPVAGMNDAPVLLTQAGALPSSVLAELKRLDPRHVVLLGGTGAVSTSVQNQIARAIR